MYALSAERRANTINYIAGYKHDGGWIYHTCVYQCKACQHQKGEIQEHTVEIRHIPWDEGGHVERTRCLLCNIESDLFGIHEFDESGVCICGYRKGDPISEAPLPDEEVTPPSTPVCYVSR